MPSLRNLPARRRSPWVVVLTCFASAAILTSCARAAAPTKSAATATAASTAPDYDLLITNGHILDGSGSPWYKGAVAVKDGRIAAIGRLVGATAKRTIDAKGMVVSPGFIDLHSHSDYALLVDGNAESKIRQGVTTEILGESASAGPISGPAAAELDAQLQHMGLKRDWTTLGEYFARVKRQGTSVNIASYVASGQVRLDVTGNVNRPPTAVELTRMEQLVDQGMRDGAIGLSSGLIYPPNSYMTTDELVALAKVAARDGGIYTSHVRGEGATGVQAIDEAIEIGEKGGLPTHVLHIKIAGKPNWGKMKEIVAHIDAARARGLDVTADIYPYIAAATNLHMCLPPKYLEGTPQEIVARLRDPRARADIRRLLASGAPGWVGNQVQDAGGWHGVMVASVQQPENKQYEGKRMDEIARMMGKDPVDALCDLLISEGGSAGAIYFLMEEPDVQLALQQPWVGIGSDGTAVNPSMAFAGRPHPRYYGTFPRVLAYYVRQQHTIALADAVRKMTSLAAQITGLTDRGLLRPGLAADITIFDPATVADKATFADPMQYPDGIPYVIVNGVVVIDNGQHTGAHPGHVLYGRGKTS